MIRNQVTDPLFPECPIRNVLSRLGDRWSLLVLMTLKEGRRQNSTRPRSQDEEPAEKGDSPMRFRDLCKAIPDVSQNMLTSTLRELEADDLVTRTVYPEIPPRVEYALTSRGESLIPLLQQLVDWSLVNMSDILKSRQHFAEVAKA